MLGFLSTAKDHNGSIALMSFAEYGSMASVSIAVLSWYVCTAASPERHQTSFFMGSHEHDSVQIVECAGCRPPPLYGSHESVTVMLPYATRQGSLLQY
jgi:hypothetical protein